MKSPSPTNLGHSADVRMELRINGRVLPIVQLGPSFLALADPTDHSPTDGEIRMSIDGHESRWRVQLPEGVSAARQRTRIAALPDGATAR